MPHVSNASNGYDSFTNPPVPTVRPNFNTPGHEEQAFDYIQLDNDSGDDFHDDKASRRPLVNRAQPSVNHGHLGQGGARFMAQERNTPLTQDCTHPEFFPPFGFRCQFCSHVFDPALSTVSDTFSPPAGLSMPFTRHGHFNGPSTVMTSQALAQPTDNNTSFARPYVPMAQSGLSNYNVASSGVAGQGPVWSRSTHTQELFFGSSAHEKNNVCGQEQVHEGVCDQSEVGQGVAQPEYDAGEFFDFSSFSNNFNGIDQEQGHQDSNNQSGTAQYTHGQALPVFGGNSQLVPSSASRNVVDPHLSKSLASVVPSDLVMAQTDISGLLVGSSDFQPEQNETASALKKKTVRKPRKKQTKKVSPAPWQQDMAAQARHDEIARNAVKVFEYTSSNNPVKHFKVNYDNNSTFWNQTLSVQEEIEYLIEEHLESPEEPPFDLDELMVMAALCVGKEREEFLDADIVRWLLRFKHYDLFTSVMGQKELFSTVLDSFAAQFSNSAPLKHPLDLATFRGERLEAYQTFDFPIKRAHDEATNKDGFVIDPAEGRHYLRDLLNIEGTGEGPFAFMQLSPDVRMMIYEMVFSFPGTRLKPLFRSKNKGLLICHENGTPVLQQLDLQRGHTHGIHTPPLDQVLALLSVNKTIKAEAEGVFYEINHFFVPSLEHLKYLLSSLPVARCSSFRNITIHLSSVKQKERSVFQLLAQLKQLHYLELFRSYEHGAQLIEDGQSGEEAVKAHSGLRYLASAIKVKKLELVGSGWPTEVETELKAKMISKPLSKRLIGEVDDYSLAKPVKKVRGRAAKAKVDKAPISAPATSAPTGATATSTANGATPMAEPSLFGN